MLPYGSSVGPTEARGRLLSSDALRSAANVGPTIGAWRTPALGPKVVVGVISTSASVIVSASGLLVAKRRTPTLVVRRRPFAVRCRP